MKGEMDYDQMCDMLNNIQSVKDDVGFLATEVKRLKMPQAIVELPKEKQNEYPPGGLYIALLLWIVAFWGEPDLVDAIIHFLMK